MSRSPCLNRLTKSVGPKEIKTNQQLLSSQFLSPVHSAKTPQNTSTSTPQHQLQIISPNKFIQTPVYKELQSVDSPYIERFTKNVRACSHATSKLGRGRFGIVISGLYKGRVVAVKISTPAGEMSLDSLHESESNAILLQHPNIVSVYKVEKLSSQIVVLMELWGQTNLHNYLDQNNEIGFSVKLSFAVQLASALNYCHDNGILHLDVKPSNVMVHYKGKIKLGDFGNSHKLGYSTKNLNSVGTIAYCAPEMLRGEIISWHCDSYSYGISLWQIEKQQIPYEGLVWTTLAYLVVSKGIRPSNDFSDTELSSIYQECWSSQREKRPSFVTILSRLDGMKDKNSL